MTTPNICQECCPEPAAVSLIEQTVNITAAGALVVTVIDKDPVETNRKLVHIEIQDDDGDPVADLRAEVRVSFVDNPVITDVPSAPPPPFPGSPVIVRHTTDGVVEIEVGNDGALRTWYPVVSFGGGVVVGPAFTLGV